MTFWGKTPDTLESDSIPVGNIYMLIVRDSCRGHYKWHVEGFYESLGKAQKKAKQYAKGKHNMWGGKQSSHILSVFSALEIDCKRKGRFIEANASPAKGSLS